MSAFFLSEIINGYSVRWENLLPQVAVAEGPEALEMEERLDMEERKRKTKYHICIFW